MHRQNHLKRPDAFNLQSILLAALLLLVPIASKATPENEKPHKAVSPRIISLAPHLTEMVYSAGAGKHLVGAVNYSDYPPEARQLPIIGDYNSLNLEALIKLKPNLILAWKSGNRLQDIERLKSLGFRVVENEIHNLEDIPDSIALIGKLTGSEKIANKVAQTLHSLLTSIRLRHRDKPPITTFYQVWNNPLITIGKNQFISQGLALCNAENIFNDLPGLSAQVSLEAVLQRDPQLILIGGNKAFQKGWQQNWEHYPTLAAVTRKHIFQVDNDLYQRPTERFILALPALCELIDRAREDKL
ncbi:cobalamin-binding protein [Thiomicrorhabdus sp.]|uniref:cobalamin-binding protein n=1 Tax=Thiomicrorhabdus sp. TaxID=2039724 RepID=UPI0029C8F522|nr:cobalamin-binding protein [Thiomicrorhabdus sp.]